ncbi:unnamed protein product [Ixodes hexagonus]
MSSSFTGEWRPQSSASSAVHEQIPGQVPPDAPPGKWSADSDWSPPSGRVSAQGFRPGSEGRRSLLPDSGSEQRSRHAAKSEPQHASPSLRRQDTKRLTQRRGTENSGRPLRRAFSRRAQPKAPQPQLIKKQSQARRSLRGRRSDAVLDPLNLGKDTSLGRTAAGHRRPNLDEDRSSKTRVPRRATSESAASSIASTRGTAAASGFIPITGPFGSQEMAYSPFLDGGSLFASAISGYPSPSRQYSKQSHSDLEYGRSASSFPSEGYGSLGSGNFQLIRGGIYADNQASSSHVPYYVQGPSRGYGGTYSYDEDSEPVMGFQGFEHFGNPLHNALSKRSQVIGASSPQLTGSAHTKDADPLSAAS